MQNFLKGKIVTLTDGDGLEEYGMKTGDKGEVTGMKRVAGQDLVFFRPEDSIEIYAIGRYRVEEEPLNA